MAIGDMVSSSISHGRGKKLSSEDRSLADDRDEKREEKELRMNSATAGKEI